MSERDPVVIVGGARTAMGGMQGDFAPLTAAQLGAGAIEAALQRAGVAGDARQIGQGGVKRGLVGDLAVVEHVKAGEDRCPRRPARRGLSIMVVEHHAVGGQGVEIRRADARMAKRAQRVAAPLVGDDEQDVSDRLRHARAR